MSHTPLGEGAEFDAIREMLDVFGPVARDIGDDAAVIPVPRDMQLVISTDATVQDVHFRSGWMTPRELGARAAVAALSDLAAMGTAAHSVLVSLIVPEQWRPQLPAFADGVREAVQAAGAHVEGGNVARGAVFSATFTVLGFCRVPVRRTGGASGDPLYVTGTLGGPGAALRALEAGEAPASWARERFVAPVPRLAEGEWLARNGALAMMDISDGLAADARHLRAAHGLAVDIDPECVPRFAGVSSADALRSGEEYELLVVLPAASAHAIAREFAEQFQLPFTRIGVLGAPAAAGNAHTRSPIASVPSMPNSSPRVEIPAGHDHFSS